MKLIPTEYQVTYNNAHVGYVSKTPVFGKWIVWGDGKEFDTPEEAAADLLQKMEKGKK
jgi:hypothetical protein